MKPVRNSISFVALCFVAMSSCIITSCEKDSESEILVDSPPPIIPVVPIDSTAKFSIPRGDLPCNLPEQYPIFYLGQAPEVNSTTEIYVQVSQKGKWSLVTDTVNGISFAGKGTFADTGLVKITLSGKGVPTNVGTFNLTAKLSNQERLITAAVIDSNVAIEPVPLKAYFQGKLGTTDIFIDPQPFSAPIQPATSDGARYETEISNMTMPAMGIMKLFRGVMYNHGQSTEADFKNFFKPGSYPLVVSPCQEVYTTNAVSLAYVNPLTGEVWLSVSANDDQSGSSFTIVGTEDGYSNGNYFVKIKAKVDCKMKKIGSSEIQRLTGEVVCHFVRQVP